MGSKRQLEHQLAALEGFEAPRPELEQYRTPADVAAHLVHRAVLQDDVAGRTVIDLGSGTGVLAIGAALSKPGRVIGIERDPAALSVARRNERRVGESVSVDWLHGDATRHPFCVRGPVTVIMNPPFGAHRGNVHADRDFLATAAELASVSYSIHNAGSRDFVTAFTEDNGGKVTHAFTAMIALPRQFGHQSENGLEIDVEAFRIDWDRPS